MPSRLRRSAAALSTVVVAVSLAACSADVVPGLGGDDANTKDGKRAKALVQRFAQASGPEACDMLTPGALRAVYGKNEPANAGPSPEIDQPPPPISLAECRRRSAAFSGQKIEIEKVNVTESGAVRVEATSDGGARTFTVTLKRRRDDALLIDDIRER